MPYVAANPELYEGKKIGAGTDVAFVQFCANAPGTGTWKQGANVMTSSPVGIACGTVIATFWNGQFGQGCDTAIYLEHDLRGICVMDQWEGTPVNERIIPSHGAEGNQAEAYFVVE